ncbi:MAG: NAD(P)/FAD-dependent oxidoreductase [Chakrabartia sp.]
MVYDVAIIGAGMAGASLAAAVAPHLRVLVLEAEDQPGYHATGRSAAFWTETYGGPLVQPLTSASGAFLAHPPLDFADQGFVTPRGALMIGRAADTPLADAFLADFEGSGVALHRRNAEALGICLPGVRDDWVIGVEEPSNADIDVAALHQAYLRAARRAGVTLALRAQVSQLARRGAVWQIIAGGQSYQARCVVNAAGAWASQIAKLAGASDILIAPKRRTMVQLRLGVDIPAGLPLVVDLAGRFYFKPEGTRRVWVSPHDEAPTPPCDAAPEEDDVALAIARFGEVVDWPIEALERSWAGLRSFAPDRAPVIGEDPACPGFYWCAGQGGAGIQTAPAISALLAAELTGQAPSPAYAGLDPARYTPGRFR